MEISKDLIKFQIEEGVFLVHKPKNITSFGLLRKLWGVFGTRKIGHAGTLDPLATGLMIVGVGPGTKKISNYVKLPKTYLVEMKLGVSTTTGDLEGEIVEEKTVYKSDISERLIEDTLLGMLGEHDLQVPMYSAIKVKGKALYKYARQDSEPEVIPIKRMEIKSLQLLDHYHQRYSYIVKARLEVSSGTYIRTLVEEFGRRMGYPATMSNLYRLSIDTYLDQNAYHVEESILKTAK